MKLPLLKSLPRMPLAAAVAATLLMASSAHADVEFGKLVLAGYIDAADGEQLFAGDYASVIEKLSPHRAEYSEDAVAASTNLCVAYIASGRLDEAHGACDEAIKAARLDQWGVSELEHTAHEDALSLAYTNRAVLTKLSGH
jgi:hypothetical protein